MAGAVCQTWYLICLKVVFTIFALFLQLVVVRADLNGHLKALKDYFLLAKGDFFQVKYVYNLWPLPKKEKKKREEKGEYFLSVLCSSLVHFIFFSELDK